MQNNKVIVVLNGGLGNQLFQLAAGFLILGSDQLKIDWSGRKNPRLNRDSPPEILDSKLAEKFIPTHNKKDSKLFGFACRLSLSIDSNPSWSKPSRELVTSVINLYLSIRYRTPCRLVTSRNSSRLNSARTQVLIGYFQDRKFLQDSRIRGLFKTWVESESTQLTEEKALVVHYRFGDYLKEDLFGMPGSRYYLNAIEEIWSNGHYDSIWIFSDDIELARKAFPEKFIEYASFKSEVLRTSIEEILLMTHGASYVISNSTFAWWAAALSQRQGAPVVLPEPWFKDLPNRENRKLDGWKSLPAFFSTN